MALKKILYEQLTLAIRDQHHAKMDVIRGLLASIQEFETKKNKKDFTEEEEVKLINSACKKRKEAIEFYEKAGRISLLEKEKEELYILQTYLPKGLSDDELEDLIIKLRVETEEKNEGKFIGIVMKQTKGRADGKKIKEIIARLFKEEPVA